MSARDQLLDGHRISGGGSARLYLDGEEFLNFSGCNYLALNDRPELREAANDALSDGSLFTRYLAPAYGGIDAAFDEVEQEAAKLYGTESAIYFASGYLIGFAAMAGLRDLFDVVVLDEQAHWCMVDAAKISGAEMFRFANCDAESLEQVLSEHCRNKRPLIATDGAYATSGQLPPLDAYAELAARYDGQVFVDESHSAGGIGATGRGAVEHFGLGERAHVGTTLSKGFCGLGAVFVGSGDQIEKAYGAPALRGSNPGSPLGARVSAAALRLVRENPEMCARLRENADYLRSGLRALGLEIIETPAPFVSFTIGDFNFMRSIQQALFDDRIYVLHSNYIAAGPGGTLRLSVFRDHTRADIDRVVARISELVRK